MKASQSEVWKIGIILSISIRLLLDLCPTTVTILPIVQDLISLTVNLRNPSMYTEVFLAADLCMMESKVIFTNLVKESGLKSKLIPLTTLLLDMGIRWLAFKRISFFLEEFQSTNKNWKTDVSTQIVQPFQLSKITGGWSRLQAWMRRQGKITQRLYMEDTI